MTDRFKDIRDKINKESSVKDRIDALRDIYGDEIGIITEIIDTNTAGIFLRGLVVDNHGYILGSGLSMVNDYTSVEKLQSAEEDAINRALASFGLGLYNGVENVMIAKPKGETEESLRQFKDQMIGYVATAEDVDHLKEMWNANLARIENIKESHPVVYRHIRDKFTQKRDQLAEEHT